MHDLEVTFIDGDAEVTDQDAILKPDSFRHSFTSAVLDTSGGNLVIARDAGGWASAAMVDEVYGHVDMQDPAFDAALRTVSG